MVREKDFQTVNQRMKILANETRRLCGIPEVTEQEMAVIPDSIVVQVESPAPVRVPEPVFVVNGKPEENFDLFELLNVIVEQRAATKKKAKRVAEREEEGQLALLF
jgi:hypothetical protein